MAIKSCNNWGAPVRNENKALSVYSEKSEFKFQYIHTNVHFEKASFPVRNESSQISMWDVWYTSAERWIDNPMREWLYDMRGAEKAELTILAVLLI